MNLEFLIKYNLFRPQQQQFPQMSAPFQIATQPQYSSQPQTPLQQQYPIATQQAQNQISSQPQIAQPPQYSSASSQPQPYSYRKPTQIYKDQSSPKYEEVHRYIHYHHIHHHERSAKPAQPAQRALPAKPAQLPTHVIIEPGNQLDDGLIHQITIEKVPITPPPIRKLPSYHSDTRLYRPKYQPRPRKRRVQEYICLPDMKYYMDDYDSRRC